MRTSLLLLHAALCLLLPYAAFGQASYGFRNYDPAYGVDAPVFNSDGSLVTGSNFLAELWGAATPDSLSPLLDIDGAMRREILPFNDRGRIVSTAGSLSVTSVPPNGWAWLQMRAWDARLGSTYEEVVGRGIGGYGESPLFLAQGNNPLAIPPELPAPLVGLQSFNLRAVVPEPSTWALLALGGVGLWLASRRWSQRCL